MYKYVYIYICICICINTVYTVTCKKLSWTIPWMVMTSCHTADTSTLSYAIRASHHGFQAILAKESRGHCKSQEVTPPWSLDHDVVLQSMTRPSIAHPYEESISLTSDDLVLARITSNHLWRPSRSNSIDWATETMTGALSPQ